MKKSVKNIVISTMVAGVISGCGGGGGAGSSGSSVGSSGGGNTGAGGGAQKGPFKENQTVTAYKLRSDGQRIISFDKNATNVTKNTVTNSLGKFQFSSLPWTGPTEFEVTGEYLNETTGEYVPGGVLTAVTNVVAGETPTVNINILTHIAAKNIKKQMSDDNNIDFSQAAKAAKAVVKETFNLKLDENTDLEDLDLTDGSAGTNQVANTQLLKISAALSATNDPEETLNNLATDLEDGGINDEAEIVFEELKAKEEEVDLSDVAAKMENIIEIDNIPSSDDFLAGTISLDNSIEFDDIYEAFTSTSYESNEIIVKGIYGTSSAEVTLTNGEFSKDGGVTWETSGTVINGDLLLIKATSSSSFDTKTTTSIDIGGTKFTFNIFTQSDPFVEDTKIKQFNFTNAQNQNVSTLVESNTVTIEGINAATDIFISDGSFYRINGGTWTNVAGTINDGDTLQVRHTTSSNYSARTKSTVTFGLGDSQVQAVFKSYTQAQDKTPDAFSFTSLYDIDFTNLSNNSSNVYSENGENYLQFTETKTFKPFIKDVQPAEITGNVKISITNGEYKLGVNGSWTKESGTVTVNDEVFVRQKLPSSHNTKTQSFLTIGTKITEFVSYTVALAEDTIPNEFNFAPQFNVNTSNEVTDTLTVAGINTATPISVTNGEYRINSGSWTNTAGIVNNTDVVNIRHTSSADNLEKTVSTLNIGGIERKLVSFTKPADDTTPALFSFAIKNGVDISSVQESENITIRGINVSTPISITNGEFTTDGGTTWVTSDNTTDNTTIKVRQTASSNNDEKKVSELTVGTFTTKFITVTKKPAPAITSTTPASSVANGQTYTYQAAADNVVGWQITNKPEWAIFNTRTGELKGYPNKKSYEKEYSNISITALNDSGQTDVIGPFSITVTNATPTLLAGESNPTSLTKGNTLLLKVKATDSLNETLTYSLDSALDFVQINSQTGDVTNSRTIATGDVGAHTISVKVTDSSSASATLNMALEITEFETAQVAPTISGTPKTSVSEGAAYSFKPIANDVNGDTLTFSVANNPSWLNINSSTGELSGTPSSSNIGTVQNIIINVSDGNGGQASLGPFNITVTNVNDKPVGSAIPNATVAQGSTLNYDIKSYFSDADGDSLSYYAFDITDGESTPKPLPHGVTFVNGVLSGTPGQEAAGETMKVRVFAVDSNGAKSEPVVFNVSVTDINDAPILKTPIFNKVVKEDEAFTYDIKGNFEDLDANDTLTFEAKLIQGDDLVDLPSELTFTNGVFSGTFDNSGVGRKLIEVTATDGTLSVSDIFEIIVNNVNDAPTLKNAITKKTVTEDTLFNYDVKPHFEDVDHGDRLTFSATLGNGDPLPSGLSFVNGVFNGTPDNDAVGVETIKVTAKDKENAEVVATFELEVLNTNDAPIVKSPINDITVAEDTTSANIDLSVHFDEIDKGDSLTYDVTFADGKLLPQWMSFNASSAILVVTPTNEHVGEHIMKITATDTHNAKTVQEFKIIVTNVNDAPVGKNDAANVVKNISGSSAKNSVLIDVLVNDIEVDKGDALTIKADSLSTPSNGVVEIVDGKVKYTPNDGFLGEDTFTYVAIDKQNVESAATTVSVNVTDILLTKAFLVGKQLGNGGDETYFFRENDIVLGDTDTNEATEFLTYETAAEGKVKVKFRDGGYDLISKTSGGFLIEYYEKDSAGNIVLDHTATSSDSLLTDLNDSDLSVAFNDIKEEEINSFNTMFKEKRHSDKYLVSGNKAIKDANSNAIIIESFNKLNSDSRAEARTNLDKPKKIVKSEVEVIEGNDYSQGQIMAVSKEINSSNERIYATLGFKAGHIYYYVGRYDSTGNTELEKYSPASALIADVDTTVSASGAFKYRTKIEVEGTVYKFNVAKVDGSTGAVIEQYAEKTVDVSDTSFDLGLDRVNYRTKTQIDSTVTQVPTSINKFVVHHHEIRGGEVLTNPVIQAIEKIDSIDIETENIDTKLAEANALLANETSPDAILAKTMLSVTEIANKPEIASLLTIEVPDGMSTTSYLNKYIRASVLDSIRIKDNFADDSNFDLSNTSTTVLHDVATKLKKISDDLGGLFDAPNKAYDYDGSSMDYNQSLAFRATLLAVAFKLENLAAYQYGANEDFKTRIHTENSNEYEYNNIAINPAAVLNSGNFLKLVNGSRVDTAKSYAIEALTHALKLPVGFEDELTQEDLNDAKKIKDALDGTTSSLIIDVKDDEEVKSINVDIAKLFSATDALDIGDFGSQWENKCDTGYTLVSENIAKMNNELLCSTGGTNSYLHHSYQKQKVLPTVDSSNIDDIVLNITKKDTTVLTGQALFDFMFKDDESSNSTNPGTPQDSTFYAFGVNWSNVKKDDRYKTTGNIAKFDNNVIDVIANFESHTESLAEAETLFSTDVKEKVSSTVSLVSGGFSTAILFKTVITDIIQDTNINASISIYHDEIRAEIKKLVKDNSTDNYVETLLVDDVIHTFDTNSTSMSSAVSSNSSLKFKLDIESKGSNISFNVTPEINGSIEQSFSTKTYDLLNYFSENTLDLAIDKVKFISKNEGFNVDESHLRIFDYSSINQPDATAPSENGLTKSEVVGKKLVNGNETYFFRDNDVVLYDPNENPTTELVSYSEDNGKIKIIFTNGEYDLISKTTSGDFLIEFFELNSSNQVAANGSNTVTNSQSNFDVYSPSELDSILPSNPTPAPSKIFVFDREWDNRKDGSKYTIAGNDAKKDTNAEILLIDAQPDSVSTSRAEALTYFNDPKDVVKAILGLEDTNSKSKAKFMIVMKDINSSNERIYANITLLSGAIKYYVGRYDSTGSTELEFIATGTIATENTVSASIKFNAKVEVVGNEIKFNVAKDDGSSVFAYNEVSVSVDSTYDTGIDKVQFRAESEATTDTQATKFRVHGFSLGDNLNAKVIEAIEILESINLETEDIDTKLASAKAKLDEASTNEQVILAKTIIELAEIVNSPEVANVIEFTNVPVGVSTVTYLNQILRSTVLNNIEIDHKLTDASTTVFTDNTTTTLHNYAVKLKKISDDLGLIFPANMTSKAYDFRGDVMDYRDSLGARVLALGLAFKLENLSAYKYGNDSDIYPRDHVVNSDTYEYMTLAVDPASILNSGEFLKLVNPLRDSNTHSIDRAKEYAIEALTIASSIPVDGKDVTQEDMTDINNFKTALSDVNTTLLIEPEGDDEIKSINVNIAKMFSSAGALSVVDLGSSWVISCEGTGFTYDANKSKIENESVCSNSSGVWEFADLEANVKPTAQTSRIDDIIEKITKLDNSELTGQEVIDFIFKDDEQSGTSPSIVSGKQIAASDSAGNVTIKFHINGNYEENGLDTDVTPNKPFACSGKWVDIGGGKVAVTCEDAGTTEMPDGNLQTNGELHLQLPTNFAAGEVIGIKEWNSDDNQEDMWNMTIDSINAL